LGDWPLDEFQSAIHWDGYWGAHQSIGFESTISNGTYGVEQYHTYGLYWAPGLLEFYLDGELQHAYTNSRVCSAPSYIILSMQMGGWGNNLNTNLYNAADYPVGMDVDYVKVWTNSTYH
jgi:beta-glucanase (GH16 family)